MESIKSNVTIESNVAIDYDAEGLYHTMCKQNCVLNNSIQALIMFYVGIGSVCPICNNIVTAHYIKRYNGSAVDVYAVMGNDYFWFMYAAHYGIIHASV